MVATLQAMVSAKPTGPIDKIHKHLTFSNLCHLQSQLVDDLRKVGNVKYPLDWHASYILSKEEFNLFSVKWSIDPGEVEEY